LSNQVTSRSWGMGKSHDSNEDLLQKKPTFAPKMFDSLATFFTSVDGYFPEAIEFILLEKQKLGDKISASIYEAVISMYFYMEDNSAAEKWMFKWYGEAKKNLDSDLLSSTLGATILAIQQINKKPREFQEFSKRLNYLQISTTPELISAAETHLVNLQKQFFSKLLPDSNDNLFQ